MAAAAGRGAPSGYGPGGGFGGVGAGSAAAERDVGGEESVSESVSKEVFSTYTCTSLPEGVGVGHPGDIAEAASIGAIKLPQATYPLWASLPPEIVKSGKLSRLQLEGVLFACQRHLQFLPNGSRSGFFIGDGAGVGKGRQIAGIILDNYARGRRKHIWFSTSSDLRLDAERDLQDIGCHINVINNMQTLDKETKALGMSKDVQDGVLFVTYSTLVGSNKGKTRLQQLVDWAGGADSFDGVLCFDECHKAKNFVPGKESASTKVSAMVIELQRLLPNARVVYCSATGVSEVGNMAYMDRMGLWGEGSSFRDFGGFVESMKKRGLGFLEMLAMELKAEGKYVARGLSFKQAEFVEVECELADGGEACYDAAVGLWQDLRAAMVQALELTQTQSKEVWKAYWSLQQRFFKNLCVSLKVPLVVAEAQAALASGSCVVIGLQSTGEAAADALGLEIGMECGFISTTREMLLRFIEGQFPVHVVLPDGGAPGAAGAAQGAPRAFTELPLMQQAQMVGTGRGGEAVPASSRDRQGPVEPEALALRDSLLERARALELPPNFLDDLVSQLGGPGSVAEMTGRKGRIVADARGRGVYQLRAKPDSNEMDSLNVKEAKSFMKGDKLVAVVSDAASTGISLHAARTAGNQRRRVHLTIELPWSADKAIQQLGRSHRSNQSSGPLYKLISTPLGGEQRFAAAVARRLQSLGALTRGDRRAASGIEISSKNLDSPLGRKALKRMYDAIAGEADVLAASVTMEEVVFGEGAGTGFRQGDEKGEVTGTAAELHAGLRDCVNLMGVGLGAGEAAGADLGPEAAAMAANAAKDLGDVKRFLNRIMGLPVKRQNLLFNYFFAVQTAEVRAAKSEGKFSEGVSDLPCSKIVRQSPPKLFWECNRRNLRTYVNDLAMDRGVTFASAMEKLEHERSTDWDSFYISRRLMYGRPMVLLAVQKPGQRHLFTIIRPNTGQSYFEMPRDELLEKYKRVSPEEVADGWKALWELSYNHCMHGPNCVLKDACLVGRRLTQCCVLSGAIVPIWGALDRVLERSSAQLNKSDRAMRVVRVELENGERIVGVRYPAILMNAAKEALATMDQEAHLQSLLSAAGMGGGGVAQVQALLAAGIGTAQLATQVPPPRPGGPVLGVVRTEEATPIDTKARDKAMRPKTTLHDFFKKPKPPPSSSSSSSPGGETGSGPAGLADAKPFLPSAGSSAGKAPPKVAAAMPRGASRGKPAGKAGVAAFFKRPASPAPAPAPSAKKPKPEESYAAKAMGVSGSKGGGEGDASVEQLVGMGFDRAKAERALTISKGNLDRAVQWMLH